MTWCSGLVLIASPNRETARPLEYVSRNSGLVSYICTLASVDLAFVSTFI
jgi:hypothetical protein